MQNRWLEGRGTVEFLSSSPDLTPVNFFVREFLKNHVYSRKPEAFTKMRAANEKVCAQKSEQMLLNISRSISSRYLETY